MKPFRSPVRLNQSTSTGTTNPTPPKTPTNVKLRREIELCKQAIFIKGQKKAEDEIDQLILEWTAVYHELVLKLHVDCRIEMPIEDWQHYMRLPEE